MIKIPINIDNQIYWSLTIKKKSGECEIIFCESIKDLQKKIKIANSNIKETQSVRLKIYNRDTGISIQSLDL